MPTNKYANPKNFLKTISQLESSGGKNMDYPEVESGIQSGTSAMGQYGLMPNTVKEMINKRRQAGTMTPELQELDGMNPHEMKAHIEANPDLEDQIAKSLALKVLHNQMGDEEKAAYSWTMGDNLSPDDISKEKMNDQSSAGGRYVDKFRRIRDQLAPSQPSNQDDDSENQDTGADDEQQ